MPRVLVRGHFDNQCGYGYLTSVIAIALQERGLDVAIEVESRATDVGWDPRILEMVRKSKELGEFKTELRVNHPIFGRGKRDRVLFTMWESSSLDRDQVLSVNGSRAVMVPCWGNAVGFVASGVAVPVEVVPIGMDSERYRYRRAPERDSFVFGTGGDGPRKRVNEVVRAFQQAFPDRMDVRLKVKVSPTNNVVRVEDYRVEVNTEILGEEEMVEWFESLDCFVTASSGEGWGLFAAKSMLIGNPVVGPRFLGLAEYLDDSVGFPVEYCLERSSQGGVWAKVDFVNLVEVLRRVPLRTTEDLRFRAFSRMVGYSMDRFGKDLERVLKNYGILE